MQRKSTLTALFRRSASGNSEDEPAGVGDTLETFTDITIRQAEALESEKLCTVGVGIPLEVLEVGSAIAGRRGRRLKVKASAAELGWISEYTAEGELLAKVLQRKLKPAKDQYGLGDKLETTAALMLRKGEELDSGELFFIDQGIEMEVVDTGTDRNVKVMTTSGELGWITDSTTGGKLLVKMMPKSPKASAKTILLPAGEDYLQVYLGEKLEAVSVVVLRSDESLDSNKLAELRLGIALEVLEIGAALMDRKGRRLKVKCPSGEVGWITDCTVQGELLVSKPSVRKSTAGRLSISKLSMFKRADSARYQSNVEEDLLINVGSLIETVSRVTMRAEESVTSAKITDLHIGVCVAVIELGQDVAGRRGRRMKVKTYSGEVGWISDYTSEGEILVKRSKVATLTPQDLEAFVVGTVIEALVASALTTTEDANGPVATKVERGSCWNIVEISKSDRGVVKVKNEDRLIGWLRIVSTDGEGLVRKINTTAPNDGGLSSSNHDDWVEPFFEAARSGDIEAFKHILALNPNWSGTTSEYVGKTALILVAATGSKDMVESLLSFDPSIDANTVDGGGRTALHHLASNCVKTDEDGVRAEIARLLLDKGANAGAKDSEGQLPEDVVDNVECQELLSLLQMASGTENAEYVSESVALGNDGDSPTVRKNKKKKSVVKKTTAKEDSPTAGDSSALQKTKKKTLVKKKSEAIETPA